MVLKRLTVTFSNSGIMSLVSICFPGYDEADANSQIREYLETMEDKGYEIIEKETMIEEV